MKNILCGIAISNYNIESSHSNIELHSSGSRKNKLFNMKCIPKLSIQSFVEL